MMGDGKLTIWHKRYEKERKEFQARDVRLFVRKLDMKDGREFVRLTFVQDSIGHKEYIDLTWENAICLGIELQSFGERAKQLLADKKQTGSNTET